MKDGIFVVMIPQLGVNDQTITIVKWHIKEGEYIAAGKSMCTLETGKVVFDIESEASGYLFYLVNTKQEVKIKQPIALIGDQRETLLLEKEKYIKQMERGTDDPGSSADVKVDYTPIAINISWDDGKVPVIVYGAGKGAISIKECLDMQKTYQVVCFLDDNPKHPPSQCGLPVYHGSQLQEILRKGICSMVLAIADGNVRLRIRSECASLGVELINIIHPKAYVSPSVKIGKGNYMQAGAIVETNSQIGDCCIIGNGVIIAHDNTIGDGCHLAPGVVMGSSIKIADLAIVGIGASVSTGVTIGRGAIISVGSSVTKDVPDYAVIEGVPGKVVGERKSIEI